MHIARMGVATFLAVAGLIAAAPSVRAAQANLWTQVNAAGACQAALPAYEGQIRKRPLAVQNEGTGPAFVTCSPASVQFGGVSPFGYQLTVANRSGATVTITCTAVIGGDLWSAPAYIGKSQTIGNNSYQTFVWNAAEFDTNAPFNISCAIPPGVGLGSLFTLQTLSSS